MGISIERTFDKDLIRLILTDKRIWDSIAEDGQEAGLFEVDLNKNMFLAVNSGDVCIGIYILHVFNGCTLQIHANLLPEYRKAFATESGEKMLDWFRDNGPKQYEKLIAYIPEIYPHVYHFTMNRGFNDEGRLTKAHRKNGELHDIHILGLERKSLKKAE